MSEIPDLIDEELIPIVDDEDTIIDIIPRAAVTYPQTYRAVGLWLKDEAGLNLLAQRALDKVNDPGKWGPAMSGTVGADESYYDCAVRETQEELGLYLPHMVESHKHIIDTGETRFQCQWFTCVVPEGTVLAVQESEVIGTQWCSDDTMRALFRFHADQLLPDSEEHWSIFLND